MADEQDQGPWTKYAAPAADDSRPPWEKYGAPPPIPTEDQMTPEQKVARNQRNATPTQYEKENTPSFWGEAARTAAKIPLKGLGFDTNSENPATDWLKGAVETAGNVLDPVRWSRFAQPMNDLSREARTIGATGRSVEPAQPTETGAFQTRPGGPIQKLGEPLAHPLAAAAVREAASMVPVLGPGAVKAGHEIARATTPQEMGEGIAEAGGTAMQGALATEAGQKAFEKAGETVGGTVNRTLVKPPVALASNALARLRAPEAQQAMTQAIQPGVNVPKAQPSIAIAGPRLQQIREAGNIQIPDKGPEAIKAVMDLNRTAKGQILQAIEDRLGPVADLRPATGDVAKAIRGSVDDITMEEPGVSNAVDRAAAKYEGESRWTLRQLEDRMHTLNNRLGRVYSRPNMGDGTIPVSAEMDLAEAGAVRKLIDESVEKLSGSGVADLKREYGAQRDVEKGLARQYAVATRVKGAPFWEGLAYLQAAGDLVSGGVWGAAKAAGRIAVGNRLQLLRDNGYLLNQAFHGPRAFEAAEAIPPHTPTPPRALLPAPPTEAGYPPENLGPNSRPQNRGLLNAPPPIEAEFLPRRMPPNPPARASVNRMLGNGETIPSNATGVHQAMSPEFAREAVTAANPDRLGRTGEAGVRIPPGSRELPAPKETAPTTPPKAAPKEPSPAEQAQKVAEKYGLTYRGETVKGAGPHDFKAPDGGTFALTTKQLSDDAFIKAKLEKRAEEIKPTELHPVAAAKGSATKLAEQALPGMAEHIYNRAIRRAIEMEKNATPEGKARLAREATERWSNFLGSAVKGAKPEE